MRTSAFSHSEPRHDQVLDGHDERRVSDDSQLTVDLVGAAAEHAHAVAGACLGDVVLRFRGGLLAELAFAHLFGDLVEKLACFEMVVPHIERAFGRGVAHPLAVPAHARHHDGSTVGARVAAVTAHDLETGGQAFDVPFPRTGERFVEVVDVEDQLPLGRAEHAEVRQVGVATELHADARIGSGGQVVGHDHGPAPIERERRQEHPAVADRHQLGHSARALLFQERDRIRTIRPPARSYRGSTVARHGVPPSREPPVLPR